MVSISIYCGWDYSLDVCFVRLFEYLHFWVCEVRLGFECWRSLHTPLSLDILWCVCGISVPCFPTIRVDVQSCQIDFVLFVIVCSTMCLLH